MDTRKPTHDELLAARLTYEKRESTTRQRYWHAELILELDDLVECHIDDHMDSVSVQALQTEVNACVETWQAKVLEELQFAKAVDFHATVTPVHDDLNIDLSLDIKALSCGGLECKFTRKALDKLIQTIKCKCC